MTSRDAASCAILGEFKTWLWELATLISIGKAAVYAIANWDRLTRFVDDARIPLDNNPTERALRGPVVGRKNHYGSKSRSGTQVAATLYTLLEIAKLHGIDPAAYLAAAITAGDRGIALLPWDFGAAIGDQRGRRYAVARRLLRSHHAVTTWQREDLRSELGTRSVDTNGLSERHGLFGQSVGLAKLITPIRIRARARSSKR